MELYEDPLHPKERERKADHDVLRDEVANDLIKQADAPPGPGVANLWMFENPCVSFSDHNTVEGARTWGNPAGTGARHKEVVGNDLSRTTVTCILKLHKWGKGWIFENQAHRGIYPQRFMIFPGSWKCWRKPML